MNGRLGTSPWPLALLSATAVGLLAVAAAWASPAAAPSQPGVCSWQDIGNATKAVYYAAAAMDTLNNHMYLYGGLDPSLETQNLVQRIDLSGSALTAAPHTTVTGVGAPRRFGAAGAFRAKGADSAVFFIGGAGDVTSGSGTRDVQVFNVTSKDWSSLIAGGTLEDRLFHAAAYDPGHDVIWVTGGIDKCGLADIQAGSCTARTVPTKYLQFDPTTGAAAWKALAGSGPNQLYGHVMVFDSRANRVLVIGGTRDGRQGSNTIWALNLQDADPANATWSQLGAGGVTLPRVGLHAGAYDASRNWVVVYGGVTSNFNTPGENIPTTTYALDLNQNPPAWVDLGVNLQQRVGSVMAYAPLHKVVVLNGGRRVAKAQPPQDVQRDSHALMCADQPTGMPPPATSAPTATATPPATVPTVLPPPATAVPTTGPPRTNAEACKFIQQFNRVPAQVIAAALANPDRIAGWNKRCNQAVPYSAANPTRRFLTLMNRNKPYHPLFNDVEFKCGCP